MPNPNNIRLRLSAYNVEDENAAMKEINERFEALRKIIPAYLIGFESDTVESVLADMLKQRGETLSVAESCTGGAVSARFTAMPGASDYFVGSVVSYSNDVKIRVLGVDAETLAEYGAVSEQVAIQMAEGVRRLTGSTYALSTTGVAGPDGGTPEKPVGTVWMAVATPEGTFARKMVYGSLRSQNIQRAGSNVINLLRLSILGLTDVKTSQGIL